MKNTLILRLMAYHATLALFNQLLSDHRWTLATYMEAEALLAQKCDLSTKSIFRYRNGYQQT